MPKKRDPTFMESLQREDRIKSQLQTETKKNLSPKEGMKKGLKPTTPEGLGRRGLPR